jgi:diaminohydroxyphosphoribosylaminopyrimidine deaminase/5-amino-6-(5-phosphoribosylamino)uracil reductase
VFRIPATDGELDLRVALGLLCDRGITRLMVEGGPEVASALVRHDLVDECVLLRSPSLIGPEGIAALAGLPLTALTASSRLRCIETGTVGEDLIEQFARVDGAEA